MLVISRDFAIACDGKRAVGVLFRADVGLFGAFRAASYDALNLRRPISTRNSDCYAIGR
jgi:hypothetical protein